MSQLLLVEKLEVHDEESYQELYRSHVQVVRLQTCHNLYFHQFLLYLVFQTRSFSYSLLNEKQCNAMIIHGDVLEDEHHCVALESHHELLLLQDQRQQAHE
ncbi:Uncharacterised protein [Streptococcus pneumoniae]|nr:Uncharacterised protein [Streptococcus pneumoniae]CIV53644.1 Uncharacterised protein [Streptococcus pneumoniae]CIV64798.1 Uncharacterised protein [Streptococcus pneumoniae]CJF95818.1 Uncharacterised protein [Streptococcus pneumoniae]CKU43969.1 Uncharacterised protein [Mycobacterium tuberculosis]